MKRQTRWFTRRTRRAIHGPRRANVSLCNTTTGLKNLLQSFFFFKFFADPIQSHHLIPPQRRWRGEKFVITPITYELKTKNKIIHFLSPLFNYIYLPATCIIIECLTWKKKHRQFWNVMKVTVGVCLLFLVSFPVFDFDLTEIEILCCHLCAPL
jgi:hypothetical protein